VQHVQAHEREFGHDSRGLEARFARLSRRETLEWCSRMKEQKYQIYRQRLRQGTLAWPIQSCCTRKFILSYTAREMRKRAGRMLWDRDVAQRVSSATIRYDKIRKLCHKCIQDRQSRERLQYVWRTRPDAAC